jgi:hypothetical protein
MPNTKPPPEKPSSKPSPQLAQMLREATVEQIAQATLITAKLLVARNKKRT